MDGLDEELDWEALLNLDDFILDSPPPNPVLSEIETLLMDYDAAVLPQTPSSEILLDPRPESDDRTRVDPATETKPEAFLNLDDFFLDSPPPNPVLLEIENLLMEDDAAVLPQTPSSEDKTRVDPPAEVPHDPVSKKQIRQIRNRDSAVKSRERKKLYVKNLELKSSYYEGECKRLAHLLHCCYAENNALRLSLQSRGAFGASMTMQESAVLLLESLLLGSLLWFMGIMCQLSLPLILWLTVVLPRENMEQKDLRRVARKGPGSKISEYFLMHSFVNSRRCRASRTKMKYVFFHVL